MPVETPDDIASFFDEDGFGISVRIDGHGPYSAIHESRSAYEGLTGADIDQRIDRFLFPAFPTASVKPGTIIEVLATGEVFEIFGEPRFVDGLWVCDVPVLDREIVLLTAMLHRDRYGDSQTTYGEMARVSAARFDLGGREVDDRQASQLVAEQRARFFVPYSPQAAAMKPRDRVVDDGQSFDVEAINVLGQHAAVQITATARIG